MIDEPWIEALEAAAHVGYKPRQIRLFYKFVRRHHVEKTYRGRRLVFKRSALDRALARCTDDQERMNRGERLARMERLGRKHAMAS